MKILLTLDDSRVGLAAAKTVASRLWPPETITHILQVSGSNCEPTNANPSRMHLTPCLIALGQFAMQRMQLEAKVLQGRPKSAILDEARDLGADLIVVGAHGRSGIERFLLGSVSLAVAGHAQCSIKIVRPRQPRQGNTCAL